MGAGAALPQNLGAATDALRALQSQGNGLLTGQTNQADQSPPSIQIYQPIFPQSSPLPPPSRLEALYSSRAARPLQQFGYDVLGVPRAVTAAQLGGVQDNYVLGEGDEIIVDLRGQENATYRQRVDRNGQIVLPKLNPIPAAGRAFSDFRADLERQVAQAYISSTAFTSVGQIRQIAVLVTGEVGSPGTRILSGLATPLDPILLSGGINKTGSLRNVTLVRGNQTIGIDLYSLLLQGTIPNIGGLRNGDRIYVPPLHNTVAVTGYVRRPGIYELRDGQSGLDVNDLIQLAGGMEIGGSYRLSKLSLESDGSTRLISYTQGQVGNGEVLFVDSASEVALERVNFGGAVKLPGTFPRTSNPTLARLVRSLDDLTPDAYTAFAVVARRDPKLNVRTLVPFSLVQVFAGTLDVPLQNDDLVYIFSREQIRLLANVAVTEQALRLLPGALGIPAGEQGGTVGTPNGLPPNGQNGVPTSGAFPQGNPGGLPQNNVVPGGQPSYQAANPAIAFLPGIPNLSIPGYGYAGAPYGSPYVSAYPTTNGYPYSPYALGTSYASGAPYGAGCTYVGGAYPYGGTTSPYGLPYSAQTYPGQLPPYTGAPYGAQGSPYNPQNPSIGVPGNPYAAPGAQFIAGSAAAGQQFASPQQQYASGTIFPGTQGTQASLIPGQNPNLPQCPNYAQPQGPGFNQVQPMAPEGVALILGVPVEALLRVAADHIVWVLDEVRDPGAYVASDGATLAEMIQTAGGVLRQADLSSVEVTSTDINTQSGTSRTIRTAYKGEMPDFQRVSLRPLDVIRLRPVFSDREEGRVAVQGQVRYPGTFDITRGERLSSVLERAGGVTETAYPYGAVFTRQRAAVTEREGHEREAREINAQIASLASSPNANDRDKTAFLTSLGQQVQNEPVLGRITVTADPAILRVRPELDVLLEPGDSVFIPPRPSTVTVSGEVLNSGSFQYQTGLNVDDYIMLAGGITSGADDDRIFVVLPDGTARPIQENWLTFSNSTMVPPGSTIVVPRDLRPFDLTTFLRDATQISSQLAVTAASLVVIGR